MADEDWQRKFDDPVTLHDGRVLITLRHAADYITALLKDESDLAKWQVAIEALILVSSGGPTMLAHIAFMQALNRNVVLAFKSRRARPISTC